VGELAFVHVVDTDTARRAQIASHLYTRGVHAEIYDSVQELLTLSPKRGVVIVNDDEEMVEPDSLLHAIAEGTGHLPLALFSACPSPRKIVRAMSCGALDYLAWPCTSDELVQTVFRLTSEGSKRASAARRRAQARELVGRLTRREHEVLKGVVDGKSNKQIAYDLGISPRTVEIHRGKMMTRLNANTASDAVRIGLFAELED
jgi:two-component system, LuxR family, response regulator FixJ